MKKKPTSANFIISSDVFIQDIAFSFNEDCNILMNRMKKLVGDTEEIPELIWKHNQQQAYCRRFDCGVILVRMRVIPKTCEDFGTLAHEIFHAVEFMLNRIGIEYDIEKSNEAYAYSIGHITTQVYQKLNKYL